jgi:serine/threonine protein kinase
VALDVARGLHYIHSFRIIHFDLKSANVLMSKRTAKISDVGLSA